MAALDTQPMDAASDDLRLKRAGLRFLSASVERRYQAWRARETLPFLRLGWIAALGGFGLSALTVFLWIPQVTTIIYAHGLSTAVFALAIGLSYLPPARRWMQALAVALCWLGSCLTVLPSYYLLESIGGAVGSGILVALYLPFMRLKPLSALLGGIPANAGAAWLALREFQEGRIDAGQVWVFTMLAATAALTTWVVCAVLEVVTRAAFRNECVIARQQHALQDSHNAIRRYLPPAVAEQIVSGNAASVDRPQRRRVTVLFADLAGFTEIADRVEAETLTEVIMEYMSAMSEIVQHHGGTLNEFAGDGLMALFGAPLEAAPDEQVRAALQAARAMQRAMPRLNAQWRRLGLGRALQTRIGINTGMLSVGSFGSDGRVTYTAIGLQTNIAARIQSHCRPGGILLSDASWQLVRDAVACQPRGEVKCKGIHFPVAVYEPVEPPGRGASA